MARLLILLAGVFLVAHLFALPSTLEDLDSINFALGVRDFDVARHQPHPPGYPIYIALGKTSTAVFRAAGLAAPEVRGLAIWGVIAGALAAFPLFTLFRNLEGRGRAALFATVLTLCAPLFWFTANRPLSDTVGLAIVLAAQALAVVAWRRQRDPAVATADVRRVIAAAAAVAGLAIGVRSQTFVLTLPLIALLLIDPRVPSARRALLPALAALIAGVLAWAIPLIVVSGGINAYLSVLGQQGTEDFSGVTMLWTHLSVKQIAYALRDTFVLPWATVPLAASVLTLAAAGAVVTAWRSSAALLLLSVLAVPYAAFHLLFHETVTVRYALPLVPVIAYLAIVAIDAMAARVEPRTSSFPVPAFAPIVTGALVVASLATAMPALRAFGAEPSPVFHALSEITARAGAGGQGVLVTHWESKRPAEWLGPALPARLLPVRPKHEWLAAVQYWKEGGTSPLWFLARPGRTDLAVIDPARRTLTPYRWTFDTRAYAGGARPNAVDLHEINSPGWFLETGWSLTPEVAGVTKADGEGPHIRPSLGYLARRSGETLLMIGGVIGEGTVPSPNDPAVHLRVTIDDRPVLEWDQTARWFLRTVTLPAGTLSGDKGFARLAVQTSTAGPASAKASARQGLPVKLEQFDLQSIDALVWGFDDGWMEMEYDPAKEQTWRWSGKSSAFKIHNAGRDVTIRLVGDSPLKYFDQPPHVKISAGDRTLLEFLPDREFVQEITVPADVLAASGGRVVIETDRTFQPPGDPRQLGLRLFEITVR